MEKQEKANLSPASDETSSKLAEAALTLYQCRDGCLVTKPSDCYNTNVLPPIDTSNLSKS